MCNDDTSQRDVRRMVSSRLKMFTPLLRCLKPWNCCSALTSMQTPGKHNSIILQAFYCLCSFARSTRVETGRELHRAPRRVATPSVPHTIQLIVDETTESSRRHSAFALKKKRESASNEFPLASRDSRYAARADDSRKAVYFECVLGDFRQFPRI